ncbi:MAG: histidinol-phosphate transaminase [Bacteroidales bacterium]|nr:histidinol-phosphate transaminase [Bacteroidales bacterium]
MKDILKLARPELTGLTPYSSARDEFQGEADIFLDANENPFGFRYKGIPSLNRYPDPLQRSLKKALSELYGISPECIFAGNGSDEIIDLLIRAFCRPGTDSVIITPPTYGMYEVQARIHNVNVIKVRLDNDFLPDEAAIATAAERAAVAGSPARILFLCSPNNPTGNLIPAATIERITSSFNGMVLVDEAYIDFSGTGGALHLTGSYDNLMVIRTFSKARGMAAARLGIGFACKEVTGLLNRIKLPYNVNSLTIDAALRSLENEQTTKQQVSIIIEERNVIAEALGKMEGVIKVWPSDANFLLIKVEKPRELYSFLLGRGIVIRDRSTLEGCGGCLRITVGTPPQNKLLLEAMGEFFSNEDISAATGTESFPARRRTAETDIFVRFIPYGRGIGDVQTGLGFLDHMLELLAFHSGSDIMIRGNGDLHVDAHHLTEDVALTLGAAIGDAVRNRPVERYGFTLPMDESLATVALDISGRAMLVWDVDFRSEMIGEMPASMVEHFFRSLATASRCTINVKAAGGDDHHIAEAVFKAFGRAMRMAFRPSGDGVVPSSKGVI